MNEEDRLKKFLGLFLFIERFTHRTFESLKHDENVKQLFGVQHRLDKSATKFLSAVFSQFKNLAQRFHWCAMTAWVQLDDQDIKDFLEAKKVRDRLAHGGHYDESDLPIDKTKTLALKLLGATQT